MIRLGISGCGYWAANIIRTLKGMDGVIIEAVADPDAGARQRAASLLNGNVKTHANFEMLLADGIDGVVIATPPAFHVEQAVAALGRGKAVFVEKPPAMSLPDMERLLKAAQGKTLLCDFIMCYNPLVQFANGLIAQTDFKPILADLRWTNWGIVRKDVDAWWSVAPHPISVLAFLFGQMQRQWKRVGIGWARAHFVFPGHSSNAGIFASWLHPTKERRIELVGFKETILIDDISRKLWVVENDFSGRISIPNVEYAPSPLEGALADFLHCMGTLDEPICGPEMIEKVTRLMV